MTVRYTYLSKNNAPIVALHSSASSSSQWKTLSQDLEGRFNVYAYDLPGYGKNPLTRNHTEIGVASSAMPVICEIEKLGEQVHLVGHSNGGGIAIKIALMRPDLVKSLTVYEPATFHILSHADARGRALFREIQLVSGMVSAAAATGDVLEGARHFLSFWNGTDFWNKLPYAAKSKFSGMLNAIISDFTSGFAESWELSELTMIEAPSLVMMGLESPSVAQRVTTMIANALPNARLALLPELNHMAPLFQPEWVNPRILEHVAGVERQVVKRSWPSQQAA